MVYMALRLGHSVLEIYVVAFYVSPRYYNMNTSSEGSTLIRVMALHALAYCERLYYLEEVEEIRVADHRVFAGRALHERIGEQNAELKNLILESEAWGIKGKIDYARYRDGHCVPFEHKRGRSKGDQAWDSDRLQIIAYGVLLEGHINKRIPEGRVHYHANNRTVRVPIDDSARAELRQAIKRAQVLAQSINRPPVADNDNLCANCSLAPVCLPEEERLLKAIKQDDSAPYAQRLFPANDERKIIHITEVGSRIGKAGKQIVVMPKDGNPTKMPSSDVAALVLHGGVQISAQTIHFAIANDIGVHWLTSGGAYVGGVSRAGGVHRRLRQYEGLRDAKLRQRLTQCLIRSKLENQLGFLIRSGRNRKCLDKIKDELNGIRAALRGLNSESAVDIDVLRGHEGIGARYFFDALPCLLDPEQKLMAFSGRNRHPPKDPFNAVLSFGYSLIYRDVMAAIIAVGLDPAIGFFHRPRSAAYPLALDVMELFRTALWDMPLLASINRRQWTDDDFSRTRQQVWLSSHGRKKAITIYETRKQNQWRHPVLDYSLSYARAIELEIRLLEKEWTGSPGLFANMRIR